MPETRRVSCPACSAVYEWEGTLGRQTCCPACSAWLHCCMACRFYDTSRFNDCGEPAADRVVDKEVANFCDYWEGSAGTSPGDDEGGAKSELEKLFKGGS